MFWENRISYFIMFFPKTLRVEGSRLGFFYIGTSGRMSRAPGGVPKKLFRKLGGFLTISGGGRSGLCIGFYSWFCTSPFHVSYKNVVSSHYLQGNRLLGFFASSSEFLAEDHSDWKNTVLSERRVLHFHLSNIADQRFTHYLHWSAGLLFSKIFVIF